VGRRVNWKKGDGAGKYINQPTGAGAVRLPVGLSSLLAASGDPIACQNLPHFNPDKAGDLLLVEGVLDALGAACLGWPALAMLNRPQAARDYTDRDTAAAKMLTPHLPALRDCRRVLVVPDADKGEKGDEGKALARRLVAWLRAAGCRSEMKTLGDLCPEAPEDCKDLADVAAWMTAEACATPDLTEDTPAALVEPLLAVFGGAVLGVLPPEPPLAPMVEGPLPEGLNPAWGRLFCLDELNAWLAARGFDAAALCPRLLLQRHLSRVPDLDGVRYAFTKNPWRMTS
jgi:hypothetical protein